MHLNNIQKKIALFCILNRESRKYEIHGTIKLGEKVDINKFRYVLLQVLNKYEIFQYSFDQDNFKFKKNEEFKVDEISIFENEISKNDFFNQKIHLEDKRLIKCGLLKKDSGFEFLLNVHHLIFDVYSGFLLLDNLYQQYNELSSKINEHNKNRNISHKKKEYKTPISKNYNFSYLKNKLSNKLIESRFCISENQLENLSIREKSSLALILIAKRVYEETNVNEILIGVPVPNRKGRKEEMGCFINTLPIVVSLTKYTTIKELVNNISKQLFKNLKFQDYDFSSNNKNNLLNNEFPINFSYYPSDFEYSYKDFYMKCESIEFPESLSPIHMTMREDGRIDYISKLKNDQNIDLKYKLENLINQYKQEA